MNWKRSIDTFQLMSGQEAHVKISACLTKHSCTAAKKNVQCNNLQPVPLIRKFNVLDKQSVLKNINHFTTQQMDLQIQLLKISLYFYVRLTIRACEMPVKLWDFLSSFHTIYLNTDRYALDKGVSYYTLNQYFVFFLSLNQLTIKKPHTRQ